MELSELVAKYGTPPAELVKQRDNGNGFMADYVGHADVTKMLIEIDPLWSWEPVSWVDGRPNIEVKEVTLKKRDGTTRVSRIATMWGFMTVLGKSLPCVGSANADKEDCEKELIGDLIRNGALRFGICINLWARTDSSPAPTRQYETRAPRQVATASAGGLKVRGEQFGPIPQWAIDAAAEQGITEVYDNRNRLSPDKNRPWFKCAQSKAPIWAPRDTPLPVFDEPVVYDTPESIREAFMSDEEIPF